METVIIKKDDIDLLVSQIKKHLTEEVKCIKKELVEKPITAQRAADYFGITEKTLWCRLKEGTLPSKLIHRSGGSVYFFESELYEHLKKS